MSQKRVLIIASKKESQEAALVIAEELKRNGYSPVFCNNGSDDAKVKDDRPLAEGMPIIDLGGIVAIDDGGDEKATIEVLKKANAAGLVVAGFSLGCILLRSAGAFAGQHVCSGFEEGFYEGAKQVTSPAIRSGNIVSCSSASCLRGFALLIVGALGGKAKNMIVSDYSGKSSLVISNLENWPNYWSLAKELAPDGVKLIVAESKDINVKEKKASYALLLNAENNEVTAVASNIPKMFFLQEKESRAETASDLEKIGCVGLNSSEAENVLSDQLKVYKILSSLFSKGARPAEVGDAENVIQSGSSYWLISKTGRRKTIGRGAMALVSTDNEALILSPEEIKALLSEYANSGGLIQADFGSDDFEGHNISFGFVVKDKGHDVDVCHCYAKINGRTFDYSVAKKALGEGFQSFNDLARAEAIESMLLLKSELQEPSGLRLACFEFDSYNSVPLIRSAKADYMVGQEAPASALERGIGIKTEPTEQKTPLLGDSMRSLRNDRLHKRLLERELSAAGIYIQPDGSVVVSEAVGGDSHVDLNRAIAIIQKRAAKATEEVIRKERSGSNSEKRRAELLAGNARYLLRLLLAYHDAKNTKKEAFAYSYDDSIPGPYSNIDLPMTERVMKYDDMDDWLEDKDKFIRSQPRYNPEYYESGDPNNTFGFYYVWEEPRRSPYYWSRILTEGIYPSRTELKK